MITAAERARNRWHAANMGEIIAAFNQYQLAQDLSLNTIRNRESILRHTERTVGDVLSATPQQLRQHIGRPGVKPGTRRTERQALRAFYAFLVEDGYIASSPAEKLPVVKAPKGEPRPFSKEQIEAMLNSGAYKRTRVMIMLGYYQGFRVSQIARVRGDDIDLLSKTIRTVAKGGKERRLPLHPVIGELASHMPSGYWFPARNGDGPVRAASVTNLITLAKKRAGITDPNLTPHSLRHAYATDMVDEGIDIRVVQELMLHEDLNTTQIYTRVSQKRKEEGILTLNVMQFPEQANRARAPGLRIVA